MDFFQAFWLAVIQGFTEFLPVSSSGHLALVPSIFGWTDQGLAFDVAVHVGTLLAALSYFWGDLKLILRDWVVSVTGGDSTAYSKQAWSIIFASGEACKSGLAPSGKLGSHSVHDLIFFTRCRKLFWAMSKSVRIRLVPSEHHPERHQC